MQCALPRVRISWPTSFQAFDRFPDLQPRRADLRSHCRLRGTQNLGDLSRRQSLNIAEHDGRPFLFRKFSKNGMDDPRVLLRSQLCMWVAARLGMLDVLI